MLNNFNAGRSSNLEVQAGGSVGQNLKAVSATVNVNGGTVGGAKVYVGGTLNLTSGSVGNVLADGSSVVNISGGAANFVDVIDGSVLNVSGGTLTSGFNAHSGSRVAITNGTVGNVARALSGSIIDISGGKIGSDFDARSSSVVNILGGIVGPRFTAAAGSTVTIAGGSVDDSFRNNTGTNLRVQGNEFRVDGMPVTGLDIEGSSGAVTVPAEGVLSGVLADGTPFAFSSSEGEDTIGSVTLVASQLPAIGAAVIDVPAAPASSGIRSGQTLNVHSGGQLPSNFNAGWGSTLKVHAGGTTGNNLEVVGGAVDLLGGSIGDNFDAFYGSTVNIIRGTVGANFTAHNGSIVNILGGSIGNSLRASTGSILNLVGTEFSLNGNPIDGLVTGQPIIFTTRTGILSGRLANQNPFSFPFQISSRVGLQDLISPNATLILTLVPEPSSLLLLMGALGLLANARPHRAGLVLG